MINSVESKGNSGVSTTTSSKKLPRKKLQQRPTIKKQHGRQHRKYFYLLRYHLGAGVPSPDPPKNCDLCEKKKHWRYKPYSQCLMKVFETAKFTSNSVLQEF